MATSPMTTPPTPITRAYAKADGSPAQFWAEGGLAQHPYQLELRGASTNLSWPRICAHCGQSATEQIEVKKAFRPRPRRRSAGANAWMRPYRISAAPIPFCSACAAEHRATVRSPSLANKILTMVVNPLIIPAIGCAWVASKLLDGVQGASLNDPGGQLGWALVALMVGGSLWSVFLMWQTTRANRLDPQTSITRSCDFSEDVSHFFEQQRRIYALENKTFAEAMAALNGDRAWTAEDQSRSNKLSFVSAILILAALGLFAVVMARLGK